MVVALTTGKGFVLHRLLPFLQRRGDCNTLDLTERAVWGIIRDLGRYEMLRLIVDNRRHRYSVNLDAPLLHPTIRGWTLRPVLGQIAEKALRERDRSCVHRP